ncbi:MAG: DUF3179 domain-containing protein [Halobacteriales archaeon]|nr:DUF3179 domain-containing protein [Halobacteriales archaeon]
MTRRGLLSGASVAVAALAGCTGGDPGRVLGTTGPPSSATTRPAPYASRTLRAETISGGVPRDGIPAIDDPSFDSPQAATEWLDDGDVVFGVRLDGHAKAYPQRVLVWHEVVNDRVGDRPLSVTYCPLTGSAVGFERGETTFGVTGDLVNNNLIAYDRGTESRWPQILGTAIGGPLAGRSLREVPVVWTTWGRWNRAVPDTVVLSRDTGYVRNYSDDPYGSYNPKRGHYAKNQGDREQPTLFPVLHYDDRYHLKKVVIGARTADGAVAVDKQSLRDRGLLTGSVGGVPYLAVYDPLLDTGYVYRNPNGQSFSITADGVRGPSGTFSKPAMIPLERVNAFDVMWFAWVGFYPETSALA